MQRAQDFRRGGDRADGFSERADLGDLGGLGGSGRPRSVFFGCNYRCRHSSSRRHCDNMLQTESDQLNQKHSSSIEDDAEKPSMATTAMPASADPGGRSAPGSALAGIAVVAI